MTRVNKGIRFQALRGPRKITYAQERANAVAGRQKMRDFIEDNGRVGVPELVEHTGFSPSKVREYAARLVELGLVKSDRVVFLGMNKGAPTTRTFFSIAGDDEQGDNGKDAPLRPVRTTWPADHRRDPLVAALFGPACHA